MKRRTLIIILVILAAAIAIGLYSWARAEKELTTVWVLCQPDSYVTIRSGPKKTTAVSGYAYPGDGFQTDGRKRGGYLHVYVTNEAGEGWISRKYLTECEPEIFEESEIMTVNVKQVNCRMCIGGRRRGWLKRGAEVTVYAMSDDWAVTNYGYIQSKYLDLPAE